MRVGVCRRARRCDVVVRVGVGVRRVFGFGGLVPGFGGFKLASSFALSDLLFLGGFRLYVCRVASSRQ